MTRDHSSRRDLLRTASASVPLFLSAKALGRNAPSANEKVTVGLIGLGGRCRDVANTCLHIPQMQIAAVCDCFKPRVDSFLGSVGKNKGWKGYTDFRKMIEKEKLDGVMVETTTHARAWVTIQAMAMGMDVYIEKPMALTIAEGRQMVRAARKHKRVTQVGTQQRSMPINNWASDLIKNGKLGKIREVLAPNFIAPQRWPGKPGQPLPAGGSDNWWDIWTNQAQMRPYHVDIHRGWATWQDYDGGGRSYGVTGWGTHSYDQIQRALGTDETGPVEVVLEEPVRTVRVGKFDLPMGKPDTGKPWRGGIRTMTGERARVRMKYANGTVLKLHLDGDVGPGLGAIFVGEKGTIELNRNAVVSEPKELVAVSENPGPNQKPETQYHIEDWVEGIKSRRRCTADIEYGQRSTTICYLVNIARQVGRVGDVLRWEPQSERFTNCDEGNALLSRARRPGYELPA